MMPAQRPRTLEEVHARGKFFATEAGLAAGLSYRARASDVFIVTPPKCGTTWVQQIVHGLRSGGDMSFDEITRVVPWLEMAHDMRLPLGQAFQPQAFKTHYPLPHLPQGGKYIIVLRDPGASLVSHWRFLSGWMFEPDSISLEQYARDRIRHGRNWYRHAQAALAQRDPSRNLLLFYEDLLEDLAGAVRKIAHLMGIGLNAELLATVLHQSSREFMLQHADKFNDHLVQSTRNPAMGLPAHGAAAKVRPQQNGPELPAAVQQELAAVWQEEMAGLGYRDYAALRASCRT
ncbi:sulfotransferase domain-containing protein [Massilia sp. W12]|uniref:sulfotransferase domain-containing protein n=1 Tax=Massilia sp. W12 TaxID=3126507 RepID=UPI0030D1421E